jgi:hypothetical protein
MRSEAAARFETLMVRSAAFGASRTIEAELPANCGCSQFAAMKIDRPKPVR